ncbi:putative transcription factor bHLH041 isoform X1 [Vicia villosa]|uniref:putative transcription factor bHLH041 isoform X1 n=1 Tax=Vicia villosa TaxID=3911 RepID=UPI00273BEA48|nr:putative transcription factor bHLH041 isoform X1 [Vicia villosa]
MEGLFSLPVAVRTEFIHSLMQSLGGCSYICVWTYDTILPKYIYIFNISICIHLPTLLLLYIRLLILLIQRFDFIFLFLWTSRLSFLDGIYNVISSHQPSSSLGSLAQQLFDQYTILSFDINDDRIPGLAFRNQRPYIELQQLELLTLSSTEIQTQFYKEARIKTAVFMGCNKGEIELGFLNMSQTDIQTALRNLFPEDFSRQIQQIDQNNNNNPPSSSSSSMRSLSTAGSPEYSSLMFINPPGTSPSSHNFPDHILGGVNIPPMRPVSNTLPFQLQQQPQITPTQLFPIDQQNDAIMRAIQNVLSTPPSQQNHAARPEASAFGRYRNDKSPIIIGSNFRRQSLMKRSFAFFRNLNLMRLKERNQATRPSSNQLHHMISERRRREKLNDNFQALRALLPQGTKKDKASILITAKETLRSLMGEIEKLSKRNQELLMSQTSAASNKETMKFSSNERINVRVLHVAESSSSEDEPMTVELQVNVLGQVSQADMLIRLLEFLNQVHHVNLISMDATNTNTNTSQDNNYLHQITFRLRITQVSEWDEEAFQEAVRRVVADLIQYQVDQNL